MAEVKRVLGVWDLAYATTDVDELRIASANLRPSGTGMIESSWPCRMKNGGASGRRPRPVPNPVRYSIDISLVGQPNANTGKVM
jgi:hypothetical protein